MKKSFIIGIALGITGMLGAAQKGQAQVVVKVKPVRPKVVVVKPARPKAHSVWIDGHWKWNKTTHSYHWVAGHYATKRSGYYYKPGHWVAVGHRGYKWVPGKWQRA